MKNNYLLIPNSKNLDKFNNFDTFILPIYGLGIGFDVYFSVNEINELANKYNVYVIINRFFHSREIEEVRDILSDFKGVKGYFIEDLGLTNFIPKDKIILFQNHITSSYANVNALNSLGYKSIVVSNELTITELKDIRSKSRSKLYYFLINRNMLMYSRRKLLSNYFEYYNQDKISDKYLMKESVSKKPLLFKEENSGTVVFDGKIFVGNKCLDELNMDAYIINLNNLSEEEVDIILSNYNKKELYKLIDSDFYFLENEIKYKVKNNE